MAKSPHDPFKVQEVRVLEKYANHKDALALLLRVTAQVQPIMRKRKWTVPIVKEFFPSQSSLLGLNVNGGGGSTSEIRIRLRHHHSPNSLIEFHSVLGTMLHELVHNVRGPHDAEFYRLLDELWTEAEDLMDRGISGTGAGFDAQAAGKAGDGTRHNPDVRDLRAIAAAAAERRARLNTLMPGGPRKLSEGAGGPGARGQGLRGLPPREAAAVAAQRRAADERWCGSGRVVVVEDEDEGEEGQRERGQQRKQGPVQGGGSAGLGPLRREGPSKRPREENGNGQEVVVVVDSDDDQENPRGAKEGSTAMTEGGGGVLLDVPFGFLLNRGRRGHPLGCACCGSGSSRQQPEPDDEDEVIVIPD